MAVCKRYLRCGWYLLDWVCSIQSIRSLTRCYQSTSEEHVADAVQITSCWWLHPLRTHPPQQVASILASHEASFTHSDKVIQVNSGVSSLSLPSLSDGIVLWRFPNNIICMLKLATNEEIQVYLVSSQNGPESNHCYITPLNRSMHLI